MDTDELSSEAYKAILIEADKFNPDLTLIFAVMSSSCEDEKEYLNKTKELITEMKVLNNVELNDVFFDSPDKKKLHSILDKILANIIEVEKIPEDKRLYDF